MVAKPNTYTLVAFDPGGTIGWAWFELDYRAFSRPEHRVLAHVRTWDCGEFSGSEHKQTAQALALIQHIGWGVMPFAPHVEVVTEDFDLMQTVGGRELVSPIRINAVLDYHCLATYGLTLRYQKRQERTNVTPERLALFGFEGRWTTRGPGKDAFAAMQHGIVWLRKIKAAANRLPWKLGADGATNVHYDCACWWQAARGSGCDLVHP